MRVFPRWVLVVAAREDQHVVAVLQSGEHFAEHDLDNAGGRQYRVILDEDVDDGGQTTAEPPSVSSSGILEREDIEAILSDAIKMSQLLQEFEANLQVKYEQFVLLRLPADHDEPLIAVDDEGKLLVSLQRGPQ